MDKYYTKPCNFYFGKQFNKKSKKKISNLMEIESISFDTIEIISRKNSKLKTLKEIRR